MTLVSEAKHEDRHVTRRCDICQTVISADCYPRTGENQQIARKQSANLLKLHLEQHSVFDILIYLKRIHQV